ncbi:acetyltransferase [Flavobacterium buctense]|uniref:Acetyltransferase n=1 Tax=Flavobacterium buctense TaxID=1648146 RepID=A0ABU9E0P9_9FLAO|nr:acetyltransferase [Flavobacterium buctense]
MAKVIIFGIQDFAELAHYYLENDSEHEVVAFSVHQQYIPEPPFFHGLPIVAFEAVEKEYAPGDFQFFAPMAPQEMNRLRESIYNAIKAKGYKLISYVSSKATLFHNPIGDNCFILENNTIQPFTTIGNNVVLWSGNHIGHHSVIKDHVMFTSQVVLSGHCVVESYATLGVNATIRDGITIAEGTFVAMAASIIKNTEPWSMYKGNPAVKSEKSTKSL